MVEFSMIGLISAVGFEAGLIIKNLIDRAGNRKAKTPARLAGSSLLEGSIWGKKAAFICSGIGAANAARAVAILAERKKPEALILFGIGGAYPSSGLQKGALAAAELEIYADCGLRTGTKAYIDKRAAGPGKQEAPKQGFEALGFPLLEIVKGKKKFFDSFPLDGRLLAKAKKATDQKNMPGLATGTFLTVCATGRSVRKAGRLGERYGAIVENMEGAAAAQTALFFGIPLLEIRGISNITGEHPSRWLKEEASEVCQEAVLNILKVL